MIPLSQIQRFGRHIIRSGTAYNTPADIGGVETNVNTEGIDTEGNMIPGLYAAGEVTDGIHGGNRLGGNAIVDAVINGKMDGHQAAEKTH